MQEEFTYRRGKRGTIPLVKIRKRFINWLELATGHKLYKVVCIQIPPTLAFPGDDSVYFYRYRFEGIFNSYLRHRWNENSPRSVFQLLDVAFQFLFPNSYLRICETYTSKELMVDFRIPRGFITDFSKEGYNIVKTWTQGDKLEYSKSGKVLIVVPPRDLEEHGAWHYPEPLTRPFQVRARNIYSPPPKKRRKRRKKPGPKPKYWSRAYKIKKAREEGIIKPKGRPPGRKNRYPRLTKVWKPPVKTIQDLKQEFSQAISSNVPKEIPKVDEV